MNDDNRAIYFVLIIFAIFIIAGFFFVFDSIGNLRSDVRDLQMSISYGIPQNTVSPGASGSLGGPSAPGGQTDKTPVPQPVPTSTRTDVRGAATQNVIPTAIIFQTTSSPTLLPQTSITITVSSVARADDGTITVNFKAYTANATSYSAIDPGTLFQLVSVDGGEQHAPNSITGSFASMPPKSVVTGGVTFSSNPSKSSVILQVGTAETARFYTFDFDTKSYRETPIG